MFSINNGLISIISYNYGAGSRRRVEGAVRFGLITALATALIGAAILWLCASPLLTVCFAASSQALELGVPSLRMTALAFPIASVSITLSAAFQPLGRSSCSLAISLLRQIVLLLPAALLLVWVRPQWTFLSFPAAELLSCLVSILLFRRLYRDKIALIGQGL